MPFHGHHHSASSSYQNGPTTQPGAATGIYQAAQALGSIGAPSGNLRVATSGTTGAATDAFLPSNGNTTDLIVGGQTAPPTIPGFPGPGTDHPTATAIQPHSADLSRRTQTLGRQPEELHMPPSSLTMGQHSSHQPSQNTLPQRYVPSQDQLASNTPGINVQQATPKTSHFASASTGAGLPGALQPGNSGRPVPSSVNTAPSSIPFAQTTTQPPQQYSTPSRSGTVSQAHSYSRSSPSGFEQSKYIPYSSTPENKYTSPPAQKYGYPQTPSGALSNSPLGLSDIRPRADSSLSDGPPSANPFLFDIAASQPPNCNYVAPWPVYAFDWCKWPAQQHSGGSSAGKIALGSYIEDGHNFIQILDSQITSQSSTDSPSTSPAHGLEFVKVAEATHSYPLTRILWEPPSSQKQSTDLLATSGDHLRLWSLPSTTATSTNNSITRSSKDQLVQKLTPLALLSNSKSPEHTAPLTSLDWNTLSPSLIITASIDTTCTIWDIPTLTAKTQLIAHDKEVFDVRFCANSVDVFVSCGADGSVRMFDLRSLEHSTIIYEPSEKGEKGSSPGNMSPTTAQQMLASAPPLLRVAASPHDSHLLATFAQDSSVIRILDVRQPGQALLELRGHGAALNCMEWSPSRRGTLASGGDDSLVLVWDLLNQSNAAALPAGSNGAPSGNPPSSTEHGRGPAACWQCDYEVSNISWAPQSALTSHGNDWLGVSGGRGLWGVKT
ncbi:WD40 repeat-like protein [Xylona heveae TC161]|uniref:WD40 repeat-like protein n=1 Tax=Xylona heveae (strain CBS 132557 / TC161) TaxID=1328760 RepID=A0A165JG29_XYLHT|nr:WD40 repeat-like protein [Xylona heveae TC161]KZF26189.1 WD40 repeat-like protein [Xylona heveae TC161]